MLLQRLEVVFLVRGVLVHDEDVGAQPGDYKAQVELPNDFHLCKHRFTARGKCEL